jgi:hypothetical protein
VGPPLGGPGRRAFLGREGVDDDGKPLGFAAEQVEAGESGGVGEVEVDDGDVPGDPGLDRQGFLEASTRVILQCMTDFTESSVAEMSLASASSLSASRCDRGRQGRFWCCPSKIARGKYTPGERRGP